MRGSRRLSIPSPDVRALARIERRTRLLAVGLNAAVLALLVAAVTAARDLDTRDPGLLPRGTSGVVVIDLSLSIADEDYADVRRVLRGVAEGDERIGLVIFSDVPYELLPPGTPARELRSVLRLLVPTGGKPHPWAQGFRAGTRISAALELAATMLERDGVRRPSILLVSDLATAPEDVPVLARTIASLRSRSIPLRVAAIDPSSDGRALFAGLLEEGALTILEEAESEGPRSALVGRQPTVLLLLGAALFAALAAHERLTARLGLPRTGREAA
ncbi:MAG: vWA domain-containing protein [Thermoleophilia bacterium]|nr:VWA domain-containing protein [Gaiellaceae bacterium]MDW8339692.1 vWA domain-containing protein [Thermoleophilia bacterium]